MKQTLHRIINPGDSDFKPGQTVDYETLVKVSKELLKSNKTPPTSVVAFISRPATVTFSQVRQVKMIGELIPTCEVYLNGVEIGDAYPTAERVDILIKHDAWPYALDVLKAAKRAFQVGNVDISYFD